MQPGPPAVCGTYLHKGTNKLTLKDNTVCTVLLCLHVVDPATSLASNSVLEPCCRQQYEKHMESVCFITSLIL